MKRSNKKTPSLGNTSLAIDNFHLLPKLPADVLNGYPGRARTRWQELNACQRGSTTSMSTTEEGKIIKTLEEDDEFEDFPEDSQWSSEPNPQLNSANLWEEDWDDDDAKDDFTDKLREELKKVPK